jgi:hypothetical protein
LAKQRQLGVAARGKHQPFQKFREGRQTHGAAPRRPILRDSVLGPILIT